MTRRPVRLLALGCLAALLPLTGPVPASQAGQGGPATPADQAAASTGLRSTFDGDSEGWTASEPGDPIAWVVAGGNPGGAMSVQRGTGGPTGLRSPVSWVGARGDLLGGRLSFDVRLSPGADTSAVEVGLVPTNGPDDAVYTRLGNLSRELPNWTSATVPIRADGSWSTPGKPTPADAAEIEAAVSQLAYVYVASFPVRSTDTMYLDNVVLASPARRTLTLARQGRRFYGRLKPGGSCAGGQRVTVRRVRPGPDAVVGTTRSDMVGEYGVGSRKLVGGTYYADTEARFVEGGGDCSAARSANLRVR